MEAWIFPRWECWPIPRESSQRTLRRRCRQCCCNTRRRGRPPPPSRLSVLPPGTGNCVRPRRPCTQVDALPLGGFAAERERESQRAYEIVLEIIPAPEVTVVEVILEVESHGGIPSLPQAEAEPQAGRPAEIGVAPVVIESIPPSGKQGWTRTDVEGHPVGHRRRREQEPRAGDEEVADRKSVV